MAISRKEYLQLDATAMCDLVKKKEATPAELVEEAIAIAETVNPKINAIIIPRYERARREAAFDVPEGILKGVPFVVKDARMAEKGEPMHIGCRVLKSRDYRPGFTSLLVEKCREGGLINIGRTNCPELLHSADTEPDAYGPTHNPWNLDHSTLGSSGGSAAAVAASIVPVAQGTDGGGSVRLPSSACGIIGFKPTRARISAAPDLGEFAGGVASHGIHTRTVRDLAAMLDIFSGRGVGDPYYPPPPERPFREEVKANLRPLKIGLAINAGHFEVHPECTNAAEKTANLLESLGHYVEISYPRVLTNPDFFLMFYKVFLSHVGFYIKLIGEQLNHEFSRDDVNPRSWHIIEETQRYNAYDYIRALNTLHSYVRQFSAWWEVDHFDLMLSPTLPILPPKIGEIRYPYDSLYLKDFTYLYAFFTWPFNASGQPAISLPLHWSKGGLPIGVQLASRYGDEATLIRVAAQLEEAAPWVGKTPPPF